MIYVVLAKNIPAPPNFGRSDIDSRSYDVIPMGAEIVNYS